MVQTMVEMEGDMVQTMVEMEGDMVDMVQAMVDMVRAMVDMKGDMAEEAVEVLAKVRIYMLFSVNFIVWNLSIGTSLFDLMRRVISIILWRSKSKLQALTGHLSDI